MEYTLDDVIRELLKARDRGPEAERIFRARFNQAAARYHAGESITEAFFELLEDAAASEKEN